jgi:hypothetical protein
MSGLDGVTVELHDENTWEMMKDMTRTVNAYTICLNPAECIMFLGVSAREYARVNCRIAWCGVCADFLETWWSVYHVLSDADKIKLQVAMDKQDIPWPPLFKEGE